MKIRMSSSLLRKAFIFAFLGAGSLILYLVKSSNQMMSLKDFDKNMNSKSAKKLAIVGHSFVARLKPSQFEDYNVRIFGLGGAVAKNFMNRLQFKEMVDYKPDFCYVQIGGNDISDSSSPEDITSDIINILKFLQENGIQFVIGEIMPRKKPWAPLTPQGYENIRTSVNYNLRQKYSNLVIPYNDIDFSSLDYDGVHLNTKGSKIFVKSIKKSFDVFLNNFNNF